MDRSLDEIVQERQRSSNRGRRGNSGRRNDRNGTPRDGVRKSFRDDRNTSMDREWVHDKYDSFDDAPRRYEPSRRYSPESRDISSTKLRVENVHYDLSEEDLEGLFTRIGPIRRLNLTYDRAGRSTGICYVTYESAADAKQAVREFDGANAKGQPIRIMAIPDGPRGGRNPFDSAVMPSKPLEDRISAPGRTRSLSPIRHSNVSGPAPANIDRYVPGQDGGRRRDGRRPGPARRARGGRPKETTGRENRPKKTAEELDAEMEDYWGGSAQPEAAASAPVESTNGAPAADDVDMIE